MSCPNTSATGCKCPEHALGLMAYSPNPVKYAAALASLQPTRLRVVTMPPERRPDCTDAMTCDCVDCQRTRLTPRPAEARQPWEPKPARSRQAA